MIDPGGLIQAVLRHYPDVQAIYLFGSYGTENEWPDSDVDMALLLPPQTAKAAGSLMLSELQAELESLCHADGASLVPASSGTGYLRAGFFE